MLVGVVTGEDVVRPQSEIEEREVEQIVSVASIDGLYCS
jgi:hypothetical protein